MARTTRQLVILVFKLGHIILGLILALQLLRSQLPFEFDINTLFTTEQLLFFYVITIIAIVSLIDGIRSVQKSGLTIPAFMLLIIGGAGAVFSGVILIGNYMFDDSTFNIWIGYYLLIGSFLIGLREGTSKDET